MLQNDQPDRPSGLLATLADRLGTRIAGPTPPTGLRLYVANALIQRAGGTLYYDADGKVVPVPEPLQEAGLYPRGVSNLRAASTADGRTAYAFSRDVRVRIPGIATYETTSSSQLTI